MTTLSGIIPAAVTPFDAHGVFAPEAFEHLLERLYASGVDGIYVCGTTGEGMQQPARQRKTVAEAAVRCTPPGRHVIVHVGATSLAEAIELAQHAARVGAHAVSSLPPLGGSFSFGEIREYYQTLAAASELPVVIYYFPELSPDVTAVEQVAELCDLPNVVGVKFSDFDLYRMWSLRRDGRSIFNGRDEVLAAGLLMGADGGIGSFYNLVPELFVKVYRLSMSGDWEEARSVQGEINRLIQVVLRFPLFPAIKQILAWGGIDCGACLPPRKPLTANERRDLHLALARSGLAERLSVPAGPLAPAP
jgi:N-acetylneuraminate lyase